MSSLARELGPSISHGPVVVVVGSRKDAVTALGLGADEVVRIVRSRTLRKATIGRAIARARTRARSRSAAPPPQVPNPASSSDASSIRVLERRLGSRLDAATTRCRGLADELEGAVAVADRLLQRVQLGAKRGGLKTWRGDVRDYARATLKAEALAVELEEQVGRTNAVVKALDDLTVNTSASETEVASVLQQYAELLKGGFPECVTLRFDAPRPCVVDVRRDTVIGLVCNAIESALYNIESIFGPQNPTVASGTPPLPPGQSVGRISLRAAVMDAETVVVEVTDDGTAASPFLHATAKDPFFSDARSTMLRGMRKRTRRAGGELTVQSDAAGNVLSIYLPLAHKKTAHSRFEETSRAHARRRARVGPREDGVLHKAAPSVAGRPGQSIGPRSP